MSKNRKEPFKERRGMEGRGLCEDIQQARAIYCVRESEEE